MPQGVAEAAAATSTPAAPSSRLAPITELATPQQATLTTAGAPAPEVEQGQQDLEAVLLPTEGEFTLEVGRCTRQ